MGAKLATVPDMSQKAGFGEKSDELPPQLTDAKGVGRYLGISASWLSDTVRGRKPDPPPHYRFGRYVGFDIQSPEFKAWLARQKRGGGK
jgi:hypothetical protein